jgi:hypothetical protein
LTFNFFNKSNKIAQTGPNSPNLTNKIAKTVPNSPNLANKIAKTGRNSPNLATLSIVQSKYLPVARELYWSRFQISIGSLECNFEAPLQMQIH